MENCFASRVQLGKTVHYLPILFIDQLSNRVKDLMVGTVPLGAGSCGGGCRASAWARVCVAPAGVAAARPPGWGRAWLPREWLLGVSLGVGRRGSRVSRVSLCARLEFAVRAGFPDQPVPSRAKAQKVFATCGRRRPELLEGHVKAAVARERWSVEPRLLPRRCR